MLAYTDSCIHNARAPSVAAHLHTREPSLRGVSPFNVSIPLALSPSRPLAPVQLYFLFMKVMIVTTFLATLLYLPALILAGEGSAIPTTNMDLLKNARYR